MAISSDFNYEDKLSLENAVLITRDRVNALGSQELVLRYNGIASTAREDCLEYLEANQIELTNPTFSFKTYEGVWKCISITYNEKSHVIEQIFKIDSQIGDLGTIPDDPIVIPDDYNLQSGDVSRISDGVTIEKAYYWRMVDPNIIELPADPIKGQIWTKTANDNGDGTYDVIVSREIENDLEAHSFVEADSYDEITLLSTNEDEQDFVANGGLVADAVIGEVKRIDNAPLENGKFRTTITTRSVIGKSQRMPATGSLGIPNDYSAVGAQLIVATNRTQTELEDDIDTMNPSPWAYVLSVSVRLNDYGLLDYTLSGRI